MEKYKWPFYMAVVGVIIGFFISVLITNDYYMNKTEKKAVRQVTKNFTLPICIFCGLIGLSVGFSINSGESQEKKFGFNAAETFERKEGRGWVFFTKWNNPLTNNENIILTEKPKDDVLKTSFNGRLFISHGLNTSAKKIAYQSHIEARNKVWGNIKNGELEQL